MAAAETLDSEISDLQDRIATLRAHRANLASILLSQPHLPTRLEQRPVLHERNRRNAAKLVQKQSNRNLENVYRACAGVTAYKVKDPDPCAVDNGNVLGVRIEVSISGRFVETYHVLFNRPNTAHQNMLKIHKHTIPPCIPLQSLANKWLPMTKKSAEEPREQDLVKFGKHLRKELVSWHLRLEALEKLRKDAMLSDQTARREGSNVEPEPGLVLNAFVSDDEDSEEEDQPDEQDGTLSISRIDSDAAVREITITWSNGKVGIFKVTKDGEVGKAAVRTKEGMRETSLSSKALGRIEGLLQRLEA
jgi:central kinetochore subunit Mal2/MCM21